MPNRKNLKLLILLLALLIITKGLFDSSFFSNFLLPVVGDENLTTEIYQASSEQEINVEMIVDVSGSMWGQIQGVNKIINSKGVLKVLLRDLPQTIKLGLRTFGGNEETHLRIPLGSNNRNEMEKIIKSLRPSGKSPIGYALDQAGKDLNNLQGKKYIILISDGIDNGEIDPVTKVKELRSKGIITHVVYIKDAKSAGEDKLRKISEAGGGHFFSINEKELVVPTLTLPG